MSTASPMAPRPKHRRPTKALRRADPAAPAIANAIYDAVGIRISKLPIKSEAVLAAIIAKVRQAVE